MSYLVTVLPKNIRIEVAGGDTLLSVLRTAGFSVDAPCGGDGRCGIRGRKPAVLVYVRQKLR